MIVLEEIPSGHEVGVIYLEDGVLYTETGACAELIEGKRALGMKDKDIYDWLAAGGYDSGYRKAYEVDDEYEGEHGGGEAVVGAEVGPVGELRTGDRSSSDRPGTTGDGA